ncbi:hypothetical protein L1987_35532 [Smallanthus sonchifolius]|uniref:Uncharacterized protein n=1 Tax=Smallanthus sonchifolius TaxID=185202 RepID=A0ACB9HY31_9ASTR|nr:hypothetical protein L1987_35532 [Smallanthus sonchifolius]
MGIMQRWLSWKSMSKARHDHVDAGTEPPVVDENYISWLGVMGPAPKNNSYGGKYHYKTIDEEGKEFIVFQPAKDFLPAIKKMLVEMMERTKNIQGVVIEDNRFCLSVHYRHVKDEGYERIEKEVELMLVSYPEFHMTRGKKVLQIRPWNKGHALEYLLDNLGLDNVLPIYIGDDKTDEDAFKVLRERGEGYPIIVSSKPTKTMAFHSLHDPSDVLSFLIRLGAKKIPLSSQESLGVFREGLKFE